MNSFFTHRTNWHSIPGLRKLLCWIGRHDYEFVRADSNGYAVLQCFYCEMRKISKGISNEDETR